MLSLRETLGLGECVEQLGHIPDAKLARGRRGRRRRSSTRRGRRGATQLEVLITSPGRQAANGDELLEAIRATASARPVRILSAAEEGRLAFVGRSSRRRSAGNRPVAVVDVGGGSAQVVVGLATRRRRTGSRSIDLGSRRLTSRLLSGDPPGAAAMRRGARRGRALLDGFDPPAPRAALAVGGSARALRRIVGGRLGATELADATALLARHSAATSSSTATT